MGVDRLKLPEGYDAKYDIRDTERAIKLCKDCFERALAATLHLERISAPLFVRPESGLNDDLNGVERPVAFDIPDVGAEVQVVHSLAKWKRFALKHYGFIPGSGLYTDMNAIRRDEQLDNIHSVYVDQWDWELVIEKVDRNEAILKAIVEKIYRALLLTEEALCAAFPKFQRFLPEHISFVTAQELEDRYPDYTPKERENAAAKEYGAVFVMGIGGKLRSGVPHDGRAPDYDDWSLNGDILIWFEVLGIALEISSMGIRVDEQALRRQLAEAGCESRAELPFHRMLLEGSLPYTIGGGIGQSRLCMLLMQKAHIGEVQVSTWPQDMIDACRDHGIYLL